MDPTVEDNVPLSSPSASGPDLLLEAPIAAMLWRLATPNVVAVATTTEVTFADAWYAGHPGTAALAIRTIPGSGAML